MRWLKRAKRLLHPGLRRATEREVADEFRFHLEMETEKNVRAGMSPEEARRKAQLVFGGVELHKEAMRDGRGLRWLTDAASDLRHSARTLAKSPGFTVAALITLALGIGANTAIFTVVDAVLLRPLAYDDPARLVVVRHESMSTVASGNFMDWQAATTRSFERMGAAEYWTPNLTGEEKPEEIRGIRLTSDMLPLLGVAPLLGRAFHPDEEHAGRARVVVLRYEAWAVRFGADPNVLGRSLMLDGEPHTIIGVMPRGFRFVPFWAGDAELAAPLVLDHRRTDRAGASLRAFARLRPDVGLADARAELARIGADLERVHPGTNQSVTAMELREIVLGDVRPALVILLAGVSLVLLIACANVAHLQLIRAATREREFALRASLGATRARLVRQWLTESTLLSLLGGALGLALAYAGVRVLLSLGPASLPRLETVQMDARVFAFAFSAALIAGVLSGLTPALVAARANVYGSLKEGGRSAAESVRRRRVRAALVVSEFATAFLLLVSAGLVLRSFFALIAVDPGFDPHNVLSMRVSLQGTSEADPSRRPAFFRDLLERVNALPGVESAGTINHLPLHGDNWAFPFDIEGRPLRPPGDGTRALFRVVHSGYFRTMRIAIQRGRDFSPEDATAGARVMIINSAMARRHWPDGDPLGARITVDDPATQPEWYTVIGVVEDARQSSWAEPTSEEMYFPYSADLGDPVHGSTLASFLDPIYMTLVIRTAADPAAITRAVERLVHATARDAPVSEIITLQHAIGQQLSGPRFHLVLLGVFAAIALLLAAVGVYGVISYSAARRTHEMGVRIALGAQRSDPFRRIVGQGMRLAGLGGVIGIALALVATRFLRSLLFGVQSSDPATFLLVSALLALVALVACGLPAWRAAHTDPIRALRSE